MEKMTPHFLKIAKCGRPDAKLEDILKPDGSEFNSVEEQNEFIVSHYEKIYSLPRDAMQNVAGCIERFLGDEILNNHIVQGSKISRGAAAELDREISSAELDIAMAEWKSRSAAGPDGINNEVLEKYWKFFRLPLVKYCGFCFGLGRLSSSLRTAQIRLIPKKGNATSISNWRPISLLNCIYKVSSTINNRLKKISDVITSRAHKGFTSSRHIQEVLINVLENIGYCNKNNIPAFV